MKIFPLIEQVLDELYNQILGPEAKKDAKVNRSLDMLATRYGQLRGKDEPIDYSEPATRLAYIYKYVTCHSNLVYTRMSKSSNLRDLFDNNTVRVACIGGGPGSDFLGILKYCIECDKHPELKCQLFDREIAWGESWEDVDDKISADNKLHTRTVYQPLDVTEPASYLAKKKYLEQSDLFTMIYFVSEVYSILDEGADDYFDNLFSGMRRGAQVLYIDNNHSDFTSWVEKKFDKHNLKIVRHSDGKETMPIEEEKRDLGKYYNKFGSSPKLEADVAWRVALKR
jgi:hypothetical protein